MLLSINEAKVAELLKSSSGGYTVNGLDVPMAVENSQPEPITVEVSGIAYSSGAGVGTQPEEAMAFGTHVREAVGIVKDWAGRK
jgi:hypothetical protein